jgi:hypothetical protein
MNKPYLWLIISLVTISFVVGISSPATITNQQALSWWTPLLFFGITSVTLFLAYLFERMSICLGVSLTRLFGKQPYVKKQRLIPQRLSFFKVAAYCFATLGVGAILRTAFFKDESILIGCSIIAFSVGLLLSATMICAIDRAKNLPLQSI